MHSRRVSALLAIAALAGCASSPPPRSDVQASDQGAFVPIVRLSASPGGSAAPSHMQEGVGVEFSASRVSGSDVQSLGSAAAPVQYNGRLFVPPQTLRHEFDLGLYDVSGRWRHFFQGGELGVELLLGLGYAELDLAVQDTSSTSSAFGPLFGAGLIWRLRSSTSVHGRFSVYGSIDPDELGQRLELALVQSLGRHVSLRAGYVHTRFEFEKGSESAIDVRASGPMLGLELHF